MPLHLRNPHSVLAAIETRPRDILEVVIPAGLADRAGKDAEPAALGRDAWLKVVQLAKDKGIKVRTGMVQTQKAHAAGPRPSRGRPEPQDPGRTGVTEAIVQERPGLPAETLFADAKDRAHGKGLWLALDSLTDPHNVGAIFRTASFFGVQGILLTQERSAPLSAAVYDVAAGGLEYVPFTLQTNLQRALEVAKEAGLWVLGTSERAQQSFRQVERDRPWLLVLGNEERGMRRLTEEACDVICQIPPQGQVPSLNVSVAAGVLISTLSRPE